MIGKTIRGYFQHLLNTLAPYNIKFDTLYTQQIEAYNQAMTNYNLRQMYSFDILNALKLSKEQLDSLSGKSYNVMQYKYSPPTKNETTSANNQTYKILYIPKGTDTEIRMVCLGTNRTITEFPNDIEELLKKEFIEYQNQLAQQQKAMQSTIHQTTAFEASPPYPILKPNEMPKGAEITRFGFYADIPLECRFVTSSTDQFEQFIILYNILLYKINPPAYMKANEWGDVLYPIRTKYEAISSAQQVDTNTQGNLLEVSFSVTLSVLLLSNFFNKSAYVNNIELHFEARHNR